jgi:DNA-binding beta-propeller fold protein YncE
MRIRTSTKMMGAGIVLSLGWFLVSACECDQTKEDEFPGFWVACIGNKPALMSYVGDSVTIVSSDPSPSFNPADWDCSHPNSPTYRKSSTPAYPAGTPSGPGGVGVNAPQSRRPAATGSTSGAAYNPQQVRDLPFLPPMVFPATPCDSSYPDILQTIHTNAQVTRIHTCPFQIVARISVQSRPLQIEITPDGTTALVTSFDNAINFIDLSTNRVTFTLYTDFQYNPNGIAISSDGSRFYVTSFNDNAPAVLVYDMATRKLITTMSTAFQYPSGAILTPDGSQLWVTSPLSASVDIFDTLSNTRVATLNIAATTDIAFNSIGTRAYITSAATSLGKVVVIDTKTLQTVTTYTTGAGSSDIQMSFGDQWLVVNNSLDASISVIDLNQNKVKTTKVSDIPSGISFVH